MMAMKYFVFPGISSRVVFGSGTIEKVADEVANLGRSKALVLSTGFQTKDAENISAMLGAQSAGVFAGAIMHTPVEVTEQALKIFNKSGADCLVAIGGGSTIGLAKAIATRTGVDQIAIPTTYAGSEMTDILGETNAGKKVTRRDASIRPETVIYDTDLTLSLPVPMTMTSALNAIAHAVEGLYASNRNPIVTMMATEAMKAFKAGLPVLKNAPQNKEARALTQYAAWLCSIILGQSAMALHHKLCHVIGGRFDTPHADTHAILLPHTAGFNAVDVPELLKPVSDIFGATPGIGLWEFATELGAPTRLKDLGMSESDLDTAAQIAIETPYPNPRDFNRDDIRNLLQAAWEGAKPAY
ncbi:MAG: maleylacetate reductase [Rhizobiales bacterium]|nr:maleylacetate reductase [Hyphomicrobiales bacterium]